jgi:hypothetical protein
MRGERPGCLPVTMQMNMKAMRHFHYERSLHLSYKTVLRGQMSVPGGIRASTRMQKDEEMRPLYVLAGVADLKLPDSLRVMNEGFNRASWN